MTATGSSCCDGGAVDLAGGAWKASSFVLPECCLPRCSGSPCQPTAAGTGSTSSNDDTLYREQQRASILRRCLNEASFWCIDRQAAAVQQQHGETLQRQDLQQRHEQQPQNQQELVEAHCGTKALQPHNERQKQVPCPRRGEDEALPPLFRLFLKYSCNLTLVGERVFGAHFQLLPVVTCASPLDGSDVRNNSRLGASTDSGKDMPDTASSLCSRSSTVHSRDCDSGAHDASSVIVEDGPEQVEDERKEVEAQQAEDAWASLLRINTADDVMSGLSPTTKRPVGSAAGVATADPPLTGTVKATPATAVHPSDAAAVEHDGIKAAQHSSGGAGSGGNQGTPTAAAARHGTGNASLKDYYFRHIRLHVPKAVASTKARVYRSEDATASPVTAGATQSTAATGAGQPGAAAVSTFPASVSASSHEQPLTGGRDEQETLGPAFSYGMLLLRLNPLRPQVRRAVLEATAPFGRVLEDEGVVRRVYVEEKLHIHISRELFTVGLPEERALRTQKEGPLHTGELGASTLGARDPAASDAAPEAGRGNRRSSGVERGNGERCEFKKFSTESRQSRCTCQFLCDEERDADIRTCGSAAARVRETAAATAGMGAPRCLPAGNAGPTATHVESAATAGVSNRSSPKMAATAGTAFFAETGKRKRSLVEGGGKEMAAPAGGRREWGRQICTFGRWSVMMCDGKPAARVLEILNAPLVLAAAAVAVAARGQQQQDRSAEVVEGGCSRSTSLEDHRRARHETASGIMQLTAAAVREAAAGGRDAGTAATAAAGVERKAGGGTLRGDDVQEDEDQLPKDLHHLQRVCLCSASCCPVHKHWFDIPLLWGPPATAPHSSAAPDSVPGAGSNSCRNEAANGSADTAAPAANAWAETAAATPDVRPVDRADTTQSSRIGVAPASTTGASTAAAVHDEEIRAGSARALAAPICDRRTAAAESDIAATTPASSAARAAAAAKIAEHRAEAPAGLAGSSVTARTGIPCFNCGSAVCVAKFSRDTQGNILV